MTPVQHGLILFAHGARDPEWAEPFEKIRDRIATRHPKAAIALAFLELMQPSLEHAVDALAAQGIARITLVPLFMAQGGHLKKDLPELLRAMAAKHPSVSFRITPAIGEVAHILGAIADWAEEEYLKP